jgi:hypothetical protein
MTDAEAEDGVELGFPVDSSPDTREEIAKRQLQPWHKPRKQWVRREQWCKQIHQLLGELDLRERAFRYLTLPGEDMLDIRQLHELFESHSRKLRYLGFDTSRKSVGMSVSEQEVKSLPFVDDESRTLDDRFEAIGEQGSVASHHTKRFRSFDAVNLDLCDAVAARRKQPSQSSLSAILALLQLQTDNRTEPWVLFLTTRADREAVNKDVANDFLRILIENIRKYERFRVGLKNSLIFSADAVSQELNSGSGLSDQEFPSAFGVGFCKWLLSCANQTWSVRQVDAAGYRVNRVGSPDMLSLVFRFDRMRQEILDPLGIIPAKRPQRPKQTTKEELNEELEVEFIQRFAEMVDIDVVLHENEHLRQQLIEENADLVSLARYDRDDVVAWGRDNCWQPN